MLIRDVPMIVNEGHPKLYSEQQRRTVIFVLDKCRVSSSYIFLYFPIFLATSYFLLYFREIPIFSYILEVLL